MKNSYYVEIEIHVYDQGLSTTVVGYYLSYDKAKADADAIEARLLRGKAKAALDEKYGDDGYNLTVLARRLRTPSEAIAEITE